MKSAHQKAWAYYAAAQAHTGGCTVCGDDDEFSPDAEAFEETGAIICTPCYDAANAADDEADDLRRANPIEPGFRRLDR